ncbi:MAG: transpeptidase family protein, partial [Flavobacteriales bacterium]|nr:transpeptidase family protein [Flavobacteriales bacterium]
KIVKTLKKDILKRVYLVYAFVGVFAIVILAQTFNVQYVEGAEWKQKAENLTTAYRKIDAVRGNIYAVDGSLLATSVPIYEVRFDSKTEALTDDIFYNEVDELSGQLSKLFRDKSQSQYKKELVSARKKGVRYQLIKRNVKYTELQQLKTFAIFNRGQYKGGLIYTQQNKRVRPFNKLAARTIGYEREGIKPVGLEGAYTHYLQGVNGKRLMKKIAGGVWMPITDENEIEPLDGSDIYTTIDVNLQDVAENALENQLTLHEADHGSVILMEVSTGSIKAIANLQRRKDGSYDESYNFAIGESTEPGSVFKLASLMAAFEDGYLTLEDMVNTEDGTTKFYGATMKDSHEGGYGVISVQKSFEVSSNVAISKLIVKNYGSKPQAFVDRIYKMNLGKKLGLEIAGEGQPLIKNTSDASWSGLSLPWMSIGYEIHLTPLQTLTFYNAVANDGKMVKPRFVSHINQRGQVVKEIKPEVINNSICSKKTIAMAKKMLEGVVENGTAKNLKNANFKIAGKTGTAQIANKSGGYKNAAKISHQASFVGYFPADAPKYSCIVVVAAPSRNVYYGNLVAGPIFKEVADKIYSTSFDIHKPLESRDAMAVSKIPYSKDGSLKDLVKVYAELDVKTRRRGKVGEWASVSTSEKQVEIQSKKVNSTLVSNVVGMGIKDALFILENQGLEVKFKGNGVVKTQSILPGSKIINGSTIILELS